MTIPMSNDEAIERYLRDALDLLRYAETVMHQGVSAEAWPHVGKLLSNISRTMKDIEFTLTGMGG